MKLLTTVLTGLPFAHLMPTGLGPWGDGMARLFLEPTDLLSVIALVLLAVVCTALVAVVGMLAALAVQLRPLVFLPMAAALALLFALVAGSTLIGHPGALAALLGETLAMAVLVTLLTQRLAPPHPRWLAIGLRVGGSWITAACLLMLGWLLRHPQ